MIKKCMRPHAALSSIPQSIFRICSKKTTRSHTPFKQKEQLRTKAFNANGAQGRGIPHHMRRVAAQKVASHCEINEYFTMDISSAVTLGPNIQLPLALALKTQPRGEIFAYVWGGGVSLECSQFPLVGHTETENSK